VVEIFNENLALTCRAMLCINEARAVARCLSVCLSVIPSVRHVRVSCRNK